MSNSTTVAAAPAPSSGGTSYQEANSIATKDIESLRVILKSVMPAKLKDAYGADWEAIKCSFVFMNRELQRSIPITANAEANQYAMGTHVRARGYDDRGST